VSDETDVIPDETPSPTVSERLRSPGGRLYAGVFGVFVVMTLILLAFGLWWPDASMPTTASNTMKAVKDTMIIFSVAAAPVMALVWAIAYYSLRHWQHSGETPPEDGPPLRGNSRVALTWVIVSSVLTAFLLIWGLAELTATTTLPANASPVVIKVTGQQWLWSFQYPQNGNISSSDLYLPVNRPVRFEVTSTDVIHSFWLPEMGVKIDANPAVVTTLDTTPDKIGNFNVRCAELCGLNHSVMQTEVHVLSKTGYDDWALSQGGTATTTASGS
jgi:cytochrome c oxidase subunit 2